MAYTPDKMANWTPLSSNLDGPSLYGIEIFPSIGCERDGAVFKKGGGMVMKREANRG